MNYLNNCKKIGQPNRSGCAGCIGSSLPGLTKMNYLDAFSYYPKSPTVILSAAKDLAGKCLQ
jgi:hypothetical protein